MIVGLIVVRKWESIGGLLLLGGFAFFTIVRFVPMLAVGGYRNLWPTRKSNVPSQPTQMTSAAGNRNVRNVEPHPAYQPNRPAGSPQPASRTWVAASYLPCLFVPKNI